MSPAARSKPKEKSSAKDTKMPSKHVLANGNTAASAYNPVSGTFHMLDSVNASPGVPLHNGRYKNINDVDDSSRPQTASTDCDSVSNNGSCSGESEDQKDKNGTGKPENPPGCFGGTDRRDKIRQKNEKKHQRQKERRAQEVRDRCTGYLMSRKLEALSQQLVGMGFSSDRATMALIMCEGRVEDAINLLLEGGDLQVKGDQSTTGNLKLDISDELAHIAVMEIKYKCARTEVERAVVSCEGDLDKAEEILRSRRQDLSPPRTEERVKTSGAKPAKDSLHQSNDRQLPTLQVPCQRVSDPSQGKTVSGTPMSHPQRQEEKDFNYTKVKRQLTPSKVIPLEGPAKNSLQQQLKKVTSKSEWQNSQLQAEKKCPIPTSLPSTSSVTLVSYNGTSRVQTVTISLCKTTQNDVRHQTVAMDIKAPHVSAPDSMVVQPAHSSFPAHSPIARSGVSPVSASVTLPLSGLNDSRVDSSPSNFQYNPVAVDTSQTKGTTLGKVSVGNVAKGIMDVQSHFQPFLSTPLDSVCAGWSSAAQLGYASSDTSTLTTSVLDPVNANSPVTSLGAFCNGWSTGMPASSADWSKGPVVNCDYTSIDWSLASPSSRSESCFSRGFPSVARFVDNVNNEGSLEHIQGASSPSGNGKGSYDLWEASKASRLRSGVDLQENGVSESENGTSVVFHEWTSPFAGKDLFSLPRQLVPTPPL
eukprot:TRINITY_DN1904_c0_g1_i1.p1 TRINITY_DN1904_c0_g1~~TRINITY_DN1904_c0_g1_i1.p1  ORF type:complete len:700 (-),score=137.31 TRINITY_DN1904_c0_g1_i1:329-2428(-)